MFNAARAHCKRVPCQHTLYPGDPSCLLLQHSILVVCLFQEAKHPLLVLGAGANRKMTSKMLRQFVDTTKIPYCTTQMGKGVIDSREAAALVECQAECAAVAHSRAATCNACILSGMKQAAFLRRE